MGLAGGQQRRWQWRVRRPKNAVENNLLSGSEDAQAAWLRRHTGIDMASCSDILRRAGMSAINERNAVGLARWHQVVPCYQQCLSLQAMRGLGSKCENASMVSRDVAR